MGTLVEEVNFSDEEGEAWINIEATNVSYDRLGDENASLKKRNRHLETQLRHAEEKNCQLNKDLGNLNFQLKSLKAKSVPSSELNQDKDDIIALREKIESLEDSLARLKIKYKRSKSQLKEFKGHQQNDSPQQSLDTFSPKERDEHVKLQNIIDQLNNELELKDQLIKEVEENTANIEIKLQNAVEKYKESENEVEVVNAALLEKNQLEESLRTETNSQIDLALRYVRMIESELGLQDDVSSGVVEDEDVMRKIEKVPGLIQKIYLKMSATPLSPELAEVEVLDLKPESSSGAEDRAERPPVLQPEAEVLTERSAERDPHQHKQRKMANGIQRLIRTVSHDPTAGGQEEASQLPLLRPPVNLAKPKTSLSMKKDILSCLRSDPSPGSGYPCFPSVMLQISENQFNEENVEKQQAMFLLALKCDRMSLLERLGGQRLERNTVESDIQEEVDIMRSFVLKHKQMCVNSESREKIVKVETYLNIIHQTATRLAATAQSFGGLEVEVKVTKSISAVIKHIASLRFNFEKSFRELNEMKNLLKQYQIVEEDSQEMVEPVKRNFSTAMVSLRESVESQLISEESETELNEQEECHEMYQSQNNLEQKEEEILLESAICRQSSSPDDLSVWNLPESLSTVSQEYSLCGLIIFVMAVLLYNSSI